MGLINDFVPSKINIGRIDLMQNFSFFEVPERDANKVVSSMTGQEHRGRRISTEIAQGGAGESGGRRSSSRDGGGRRDSHRGGSNPGSRDRKPSASHGGQKKEHRKGGRKPKYS